MSHVSAFALSVNVGLRTSRQISRTCPHPPHLSRCISAKADVPPRQKDFSLEAEIQQARKEARPYRIDKSKLTAAERQTLRLRSRSIPLVADSEPLDVIYEDDVYLVVNKPSFLKMHPSHRFEGGSLLNRAIGHCGFAPKVMHRLDMHTTGVVVLGKTKEICKPIMKQFMAGRVKKQYLCIVDGVTDVQVGLSFTVDAPIEKSGVSFLRQVGDSREDSKPAQTVYTVLDKSSTVPMVLLHAAPLTGRTHQIRLHAKEALLPIVGDDLYNPKEHDMYASIEEISAAAKQPELVLYADNNPLRKGLKLHAWKITFQNPIDDTELTFCAPPPSHMSQLLSWAEMEAPKS